MPVNIDDLVCKLLLLGVPLVGAGCFGAQSSCDGYDPKPTTVFREIENPARRKADAGPYGPTTEAYDRCVGGGDCVPLCEQAFFHEDVKSCVRVASDGGATTDERVAVRASVIYLCEGRRPEGVGATPVAACSSEVGAWLAGATYLEAVSVPAFERLARELCAHGAPESLVRAGLRAAADERRHVRLMGALARRFGAAPPPVPAGLPDDVRTLDAMAEENAVEGCVRETLGALVARHQAHAAGDARIRAAMKLVARDEARHAELAWQVDAWARSRLSPRAGRRVARTRREEAARLARDVAAHPPAAALVTTAGFPTAAVGAAIVAGTRALLWDHPAA